MTGLTALMTGGETRAEALSVLSLNIHGLPALIAGDDPAARIPEIVRLAAAYDVVLLQEDFSWQAATDALGGTIVRGPTSGRPFGSGLTIRVAPGRAEVVARAHRSFNLCAGILAGGQDCFADKGVLMARLRLPDGLEFDAYTTHLEAGGRPVDQDIRIRQLAMIADFMRERSTGRAVVLGGDLNLDWKAPGHRRLIEEFLARTGLSRLETGHDGRRIDHVLVRDLRGEAAEAVDFGGLSDHPALGAVVRPNAKSPRPPRRE